MQSIKDEPAFPTTNGPRSLTKREWFIGQALSGLASSPGCMNTPNRLVEMAISTADKIILALDEERESNAK